MENQYDYIISGAGAAGLSLLMRMIKQPALASKKILVVDKSPKNVNDRTWCFWENKEGLFEPVVHHKWQQVHFFSETFTGPLHLHPYWYKMIRGIDFYNHVLGEAAKQANVHFVYGNIIAAGNEGNQAFVIVDENRYYGEYVFNSVLFQKPALPKSKFYLLQHFKGFVIETEKDEFDSANATLMDFRISQQHGTTFMYVLPVSATRALVEYTLFTNDLLNQEAYSIAIRDYIYHYLQIENYRIVEEEFGVIPMTNFSFTKNVGRVMNIGTAGGQTKASSGYTFQFIQKQTAQIVDDLAKDGNLKNHESIFQKRFAFYDSTLLNILHHGKLGGDKIFADLFKNNPPERVLRFLDNESTLEDELNIMGTLPKGIFFKAAMQELFK